MLSTDLGCAVAYYFKQQRSSFLKRAIRRFWDVWFPLYYTSWRLLHTDARPVRPIFIIGTPRSGKSLTAKLSSFHPEISYVSESKGARLWDVRSYHDPDADHHRTAEALRGGDARRIATALECLRRMHGGGRVLSDHARNSVRIGYIRAIFPDVLFVHIVRDGRVVVREMLRAAERDPRRYRIPMLGYCKPPGWRSMLDRDLVRQTARQWVGVVSYVRGWREELGSSYHEMRFEDLCHDPRQEIRKVWVFAGLAWDEQALSRIPVRLDLHDNPRAEDLPREDLAKVEEVAGSLLAQLGYKPSA